MTLPKCYPAFAAALVCVAVVGLTARTAFRAYEWSDAELFFKQTIADGGSSARVSLNLARIYSVRGEHGKAEQVLRETIERYPDHPNARINLGISLLKQGRAQEAEAFLKFDNARSEKIASLYPHTWSSALNIAQMRCNEGKTDEALAVLDDAGQRYPEIWEVAQFKAQILERNYGAARAVPVVEKYAQAHWWHYDSQLSLGRLRGVAGDFAGAVTALNSASRLDVHAVEPFQLMARLNFAQNRAGDALDAQKHAIRRGSNQPSQYLFLAAILEQMNRKDEAEAAVKKAESLRDSVRVEGKYL
jgi:Flp pilus assembly protein TadD